MFRFLQANVNRSRAAQDLLRESARIVEASLVIVREPNDRRPAGDDNWFADDSGDVAVFQDPAVVRTPYRRLAGGAGYVIAKNGTWCVAAAYHSPNRDLADFNRFLEELGRAVDRVRGADRLLVVAGDLKAKSAAWGSRVATGRGEALCNWMAERGLATRNRSPAPT